MIKYVAILGGLGVLLGAFGAHSLKDLLTPAQLSSYLTGVQYHLIHTAACLAIALYSKTNENHVVRTSFRLFVMGVTFFSGSIYLLSCQDIFGLSLSFLWPVTPIGGLLLTAGWLNLLRSN